MTVRAFSFLSVCLLSLAGVLSQSQTPRTNAVKVEADDVRTGPITDSPLRVGTYLGGKPSERGRAIAVDAAGTSIWLGALRHLTCLLPSALSRPASAVASPTLS